MAEVKAGRWTAEIDGDFVVFLIGARRRQAAACSGPCATSAAAAGMMHMLEYLTEHPEKGLLGYEMSTFGGIIVQYWRSFEHLERFANDVDDPHLAAWRNYWKRVGKDTRTGIWHETYLVRAGRVRGDLRQHAAVRARQGVLVGDVGRGQIGARSAQASYGDLSPGST